MSFVGQQAAAEQPPALSLEETLALLDAFGGGDSCSGGGSPLSCTESSSTSLDDLDELLAEVATPPSAWSDSDDASSLAEMLSANKQLHPPPQRPKRKAAAATPAAASSATLETTEDDDDEDDDEEEHGKGAQRRPAAAAKAPRKRRPRKQPKTEILRLRDEAEELQLRLLQLQKTSSSARSSSSTDAESEGAMVAAARQAVVLESPRAGASWLDIAVDQFKALQKAEELNEKLKAEVARQTRFGEALKTQFTKKIAQQGPGFVHELEPAKPSTAVVRSGRSAGDADADELYQSVQKMHIETDRLRREIAAESDVSAIFNSSKMKFEAHGPVFEFKTSTPIDHPDFHRVGFSMWHRATTLGDDHTPREGDGRPPPVNHRILGANELHQRPVSMKMSSRSGSGDVQVNGVVVMCKLDTATRCVFTFASTLAIGGSSAFVLREHGWMIFAPHDTDTAKSVFQVFYHLESETRTADALTDSDKAIRQHAMKALSDNIKFFLTDVQHMFGESTDFFDLTHYPVSCPLHKVYIE